MFPSTARLNRLAGTCLALALAAAPAEAAAEVAPGSDFTFKRVRVGVPQAEPFKRARVPPAGTRKRITVQITPTPPAPAAIPDRPRDPALPPARPQRPQDYAFFWEAVPPGLGPAAAERLALAIGTLEAARSRGVPLFGQADRMRAVSALYRPHLEAAAARHGVSAAFLLAVMTVESSGALRALSPKGAQGLMQLMPGTARRFGVTDPWDPGQNIRGGAEYLDLLLRMFGEDPLLALAGYNAGENAVLSAQGVPRYAETRDYVPKVLGAWLQARRLCAVPPATVRDACLLGPEAALRPLPFAGPS